jgi:type I restriction enzyme, S subunit
MSVSIVKVSDLSEQIRGVSYGKDDASKTPKEGYIPILRAGNITDNGLTFDDLVFVPNKRVSLKQMIRRHDIVIAASSGSLDIVGKAAPVLNDFIGSFGAFCKVLRPSSKVDPSYFAHCFKTHDYRRRISSLAAGANINNLRNEHLDDLKISLPPLEEQKRIAEILDRAESLRAMRRQSIEQLNTLTQAIFLEMFGDPVTNPRGWSQTRFEDTLSIPLRNGSSPSHVGKLMHKVLTLSAITGNKFNETAWKTSTFKFIPPVHQRVDRADFLICRGNGNLHLVGKGYFPTEQMPDVTFPDTIIAARISSEHFEREFLEHIWNSTMVRRQIESSARTTNGTLKVNQTMLENIVILTPPLPLQHEFAQRVKAIEKLKATHQKSLTELDALFASLQHRAFRGEL